MESFTASSPPEVYDLVRFKLRLGRQSLEITAVVSPLAGKPVTNPGYKVTADRLKASGVQLADDPPSDRVDDIEVVLGLITFPRSSRASLVT